MLREDREIVSNLHCGLHPKNCPCLPLLYVFFFFARDRLSQLSASRTMCMYIPSGRRNGVEMAAQLSANMSQVMRDPELPGQMGHMLESIFKVEFLAQPAVGLCAVCAAGSSTICFAFVRLTPISSIVGFTDANSEFPSFVCPCLFQVLVH